MSFKFTEREIRALEECPEAYEILKNHHSCQITMADAVNDECIFDGSMLYHGTRIVQLEEERLRLEALI